MATVESVLSSGRDNPSPRVPISRYPLVQTRQGIDYEINKVTRDNRGVLRRRALPFEQQFGYPDSFEVHEKVVHYIREGGEVVFARTTGRRPKDIGVVTQEMRKASVAGRTARVLSVGIRVVLPEFQRHGIGTYLEEDAVLRHRPDAVTGQTRMWRIISMLQNTGFFSRISPFDGLITPEVEQILRGGVLDRRTLSAITDIRRGLCLGIYPPADREHFIPPPTSESGVRNYNRILILGAVPERGDGIRYYAEVDQEAVRAAKARGEVAYEKVEPAGLRSRLRLIPDVIDVLWRLRRPR